MKHFLILTVFLIFISNFSFSCTTFVLKYLNKIVFGRNLDWVSENGLLIVNQRNVYKKSIVFANNQPVEWTSKYGSVTFNQFGKKFPFGGINEKGLVVEIMVSNADYPEIDDRKALNELQWVQYQLDNCATIEEVIETDKNIRISPIAHQLHFLICDKDGNVAVIEFFHGKMLVYKQDNLPYPVLANDDYKISLEEYKNKVNSRFTIAVNMIKNYNKNFESIIDYSFNILDSVVIIGDWQIVYDVSDMKIYFKTATIRNIRFLDLKNLNFNCSKACQMYDLLDNGNGNIEELLIPFKHKMNKNKMKDALNGTYF